MTLSEAIQGLPEEFRSAPPAKIEPPNRLSLEQAKTRSTDIKKFCKEILREGTDYGIIPGTSKKVLYKPGAEKVCQFLMLRPSFEPVTVFEDFEKPLFFYRYRCELYHIGTGELVGSGIGSCNSHETKYRWRNARPKCPICGAEKIYKSKFADRNTGDMGFYCHKNKGGCGAQFHSADENIIWPTAGRVQNEEVFDQINTIDKMAQKRALLAPVLIVSGLSDEFTQDLEDTAPEPKKPSITTTAKSQPQNKSMTNSKCNGHSKPPHGGHTGGTESEMFKRAKVKIAEVCEKLVEGGYYNDVDVALKEIMENKEVTFEHIQNVADRGRHKKVVAAIAKAEKILGDS